MEKNLNLQKIVNLFLERFGDGQETSSKNKSIDPIWDLGDLIKKEIDKEMSFEELISFAVPQLIYKTDLKRNTIVRNLRVSFKVVKLFPKKQEWLKVTPKIVNLKKLKLLENLLNPDYRKENGIPNTEITNLMNRLKDMKGEELAKITKKIHSKYIKGYLDIDYEVIWVNCDSINIILEEVIHNNNSNFIKNFRETYNKIKLNNIRLFLSMVKNEKVFEKHRSKFKSFDFIDKLHNTQLVDFNNNLNQLLQELIKIEKSNEAQRMKMRSDIPISWLGQISTRLKALSEDQELKRYKLNESILKKVLEGT